VRREHFDGQQYREISFSLSGVDFSSSSAKPSVLSVAFLSVLCVKFRKARQKIGASCKLADGYYFKGVSSPSFPLAEPNTGASLQSRQGADKPDFLTATARLAMVPPMLQILNYLFLSTAALVFSFQIIANVSATS
jgi:hypothetical protein